MYIDCKDKNVLYVFISNLVLRISITVFSNNNSMCIIFIMYENGSCIEIGWHIFCARVRTANCINHLVHCSNRSNVLYVSQIDAILEYCSRVCFIGSLFVHIGQDPIDIPIYACVDAGPAFLAAWARAKRHDTRQIKEWILPLLLQCHQWSARVTYNTNHRSNSILSYCQTVCRGHYACNENRSK